MKVSCTNLPLFNVQACKIKGVEVYKSLDLVSSAHIDSEGGFDPMDPSQPVIVHYICVNLSVS